MEHIGWIWFSKNNLPSVAKINFLVLDKDYSYLWVYTLLLGIALVIIPLISKLINNIN